MKNTLYRSRYGSSIQFAVWCRDKPADRQTKGRTDRRNVWKNMPLVGFRSTFIFSGTTHPQMLIPVGRNQQRKAILWRSESPHSQLVPRSCIPCHLWIVRPEINSKHPEMLLVSVFKSRLHSLCQWSASSLDTTSISTPWFSVTTVLCVVSSDISRDFNRPHEPLLCQRDVIASIYNVSLQQLTILYIT